MSDRDMSDTERKLMQHEIDCEKRYGELNKAIADMATADEARYGTLRTRLASIGTECERNTRLLWVILGLMTLVGGGVLVQAFLGG